MGNEDNQSREQAVQDRIARFMQAEQGHPAPVSDQEQQALKDAAARLDQLLSASAEADVLVLQVAAARLDQLLADIAAGKDVSPGVKQRTEKKDTSE
jgi:hypothetical protein